MGLHVGYSDSSLSYEPNTYLAWVEIYIHQSLLSHRLVYNGGISNFELPSLVRNSTYVAQTLCGLSYKVWSPIITKFGTTELFNLILDIPKY